MTADAGLAGRHRAATEPLHSVRFFTKDEYPAPRIARFLHDGLSRGEAALLFASPDHQRSIAKVLEERGLDVEECIETRRLALGNAEVLASSLVDAGRPNPSIFQAMIGSPVREAVSRYGSARAYGEVFGIIVERHDLDGALVLERLWDELLRESRNTRLLCGYSLWPFSAPESTRAFSRICDAHSRIETARDQRAWSMPRLLVELEQRTLALEQESARRRAVERERDGFSERAEAADRAKHEFLAMLGHELRNPLSPILTAVQLMNIRGEEALVKERRIIERQVNHMVRLVDDLLDVSRVARGKLELRLSAVEIARVVADAIDLASPLLEERSHRLVTSVPASGLSVNADQERLAQVVANLLTNAARYTPPGGVVTVTARQSGARVEITVRDNGVGIEPDLLPRVFDLFVQGRQTFDRPHGGLGLGLSIARNLVEMHGGSLRGESEGVGRGSLFTLELDRVPSERQEGSTESTPVVAARISRRVLVVDDNRVAADGFSEFLEAAGHTTRVAYDGLSALEAAGEFRPEVALLDLGLPVMDGHELAGRLLSLLSDEPPRLIAITGYGDQLDRQRTCASGFDRHLLKPIDLTELFELLENLGGKPSPPTLGG